MGQLFLASEPVIQLAVDNGSRRGATLYRYARGCSPSGAGTLPAILADGAESMPGGGEVKTVAANEQATAYGTARGCLQVGVSTKARNLS